MFLNSIITDTFMVLFSCTESVTLCSFFKVDAALIATGRAPFTSGLGLENVRDDNKAHPLMNKKMDFWFSEFIWL